MNQGEALNRIKVLNECETEMVLPLIEAANNPTSHARIQNKMDEIRREIDSLEKFLRVKIAEAKKAF